MSELKRVQERLNGFVDHLTKLKEVPVQTDWGKGYNDGVDAAIRLMKADLVATECLIKLNEL